MNYNDHGTKVTETDALGHATNYGYNAAGQLGSVTDAMTRPGVTSYVINEFGEMTSQVDAKERITHFEYDVMGRRTARVLPLCQREEWTHLPGGQVEAHTDF